MDYKIDKSSWPDGPWKDEPDRVEFVYRDIECLIKRGILGQLNGYAILPKDLVSDSDDIYDVHGGITFDEKIGDTRMIGFDCAHSDDIVPEILSNKLKFHKNINERFKLSTEMYRNQLEKISSYKDINFVKNEIEKMVDQVLDGNDHGCDCYD